MNEPRYNSFRRASATLDRLGPAKLHKHELELLQDSAEGLLLSREATGEEAGELREQARQLLGKLVDCDRWTEGDASGLLEAIEGCCPEAALV